MDKKQPKQQSLTNWIDRLLFLLIIGPINNWSFEQNAINKK